MKLEIKISGFLKTGKFGRVEINDSMETVIEKLGKPDGEYNPNAMKSRKGIHYSMYEFMFLDDKLVSIQNDRFDIRNPELMEFENDVFRIDPEFLKADRIKKMGEIESMLNRLNIDYSVIEYWGRRVIKTTGGVVVDFNNEKWSDKHGDFVNIENQKDFELIGITWFLA